MVVSVEYRLAPEHAFPAACEDAVDAALFALSDAGAAQLRGSLRVIAGESAGGYLTMWAAIEPRNRGINVRDRIEAVVPIYGTFDMSFTPSLRSHKRNIFISSEDAVQFSRALLPLDTFPESRHKDASISPVYANLVDLPPALFLIGTQDPLLDDSVFMASRYSLAGNVTELKIVQEACHGFTLVPDIEMATEGNQEVFRFLRRQLK